MSAPVAVPRANDRPAVGVLKVRQAADRLLAADAIVKLSASKFTVWPTADSVVLASIEMA
jgi:hypothetical protein